MKKIFRYALFALLCVGCATTTPTPEPTPQKMLATETPSPVKLTETPALNFAETIAANQTQKAIFDATQRVGATELAAKKATNIANIVITPSPTPLPLGGLDFEGLPDWLSKSSDELLMTYSYDRKNDSYGVIIANPQTGDLFEMPFPLNTDKFFWAKDGKAIGLMTTDLSQIFEITLSNGQIAGIQPSAFMTQFLNPAAKSIHWPNAIIEVAPKALQEPYFIYSSHQWKISQSGIYFVPDDTLNELDYTSVFNLLTEQEYQISYPEYSPEYLSELRKNNSYVSVHIEWSPVIGLLGILSQDTFRIYDVENQTQVARYDDLSQLRGPLFANGSVKWSPDGTRILFGAGDDAYINSVACIFDTLTAETTCLNKIRNYHGQIFIGNFKWSPDGSKISYVTYIQDIYTAPFRLRGDLCLYDLVKEQIDCVTKEMEFLENQAILFYEWSPSGKYIAFIADESCPACDYSNAPKIWMISTDGSKNIYVAPTTGDFWQNNLLWRK